MEEEEREKAKLRQQEKEHAELQELERQKQLEQQRRDENERLVTTNSLPLVIPSAPPAEDNNSGIPPDLTTTSKTYPTLSDGTSHIETAEVERFACI